VEPNGLETRYRYDDNGNLVGVTDPSNRRTEYRYDRLNRRTHHIVHGADPDDPADDLITQWELDANGNARRITDPLGQVVEYEYDALDRRFRGEFPAARNPAVETALREVRWVYDANGNVDRVEADKVFGTDSWTETTVQTWDALDRLEATTTRGVAISMDYDPAGNRTLVATAEGATSYTYDARHRLDYATIDGERVEYTSLTDGRMDSVLYPNGTRTTYGYHPLTNRLTSLDHERDDERTWRSFARAEVEWDGNGNRTQDHVTIGGVTETTGYDYDSLDRMIRHVRTSSVGGDPEQVVYEYAGYERRIERTIPSVDRLAPFNRERTYTYEPSYGWLTQVDDLVVGEGTTTVTYGYDRNGNTSWRRNSRNSEEMRFAYDVFDQLQHVERGVVGDLTPGESLGRYDYDVDGRRIRVRNGDRGDV
ncbi:MAG: RHS repeat protein, partial [Myxococcales bacterium]|nr:RHS repeat protein [Myxococcales bacterium]